MRTEKQVELDVLTAKAEEDLLARERFDEWHPDQWPSNTVGPCNPGYIPGDPRPLPSWEMVRFPLALRLYPTTTTLVGNPGLLVSAYAEIKVVDADEAERVGGLWADFWESVTGLRYDTSYEYDDCPAVAVKLREDHNG